MLLMWFGVSVAWYWIGYPVRSLGGTARVAIQTGRSIFSG